MASGGEAAPEEKEKGVKEFTFQIGPTGLSVVKATGKVIRIDSGSQGALNKVKYGWRVLRINGKDYAPDMIKVDEKYENEKEVPWELEGETKVDFKAVGGKPKDEDAPVKPKNAFQRITGEARARLKVERPELAMDLKGMALAMQECWDNTPQAEKDRLTQVYEDEMEIFRPKWEAYKQTKHYKEFFEVKQDWYDARSLKKLAKTQKKEQKKTIKVDKPLGFEISDNKVVSVEPGTQAAKSGIQVGWVCEKVCYKANDQMQEVAYSPESFDTAMKSGNPAFSLCFQDPDVPKRPKSGYMLFANSVRDRVKKAVMEAGGGMGDIGVKISEEWTELSETKKAEFGEQALRQKEQFDKEYAVFRTTKKFRDFADDKDKLMAKLKLKKNFRVQLADAPKKAPSPLTLYRREVGPQFAEELKGLGIREQAKIIAQKWNDVPQEKKKEYIAEAERLKQEFDKQKDEFKAKQQYTQFLETRYKVKSRENKQVSLRDMPKRPKSVFAMFADKHKNEVPQGKGEGKGRDALKKMFMQADDKLTEEKEELMKIEQEGVAKWKQEIAAYKESDKYKTYVKNESKFKNEFMNEAMKVMTLRFLSDAPPQPPKSPFAVYLGEKRKARDEPEVKMDKKARFEEVKKFRDEFAKLDRDTKKEFDNKRKEMFSVWKEKVKSYMEQDKWKSYVAEAKRLRVPLRNLLCDKKKVIKKLKNGMRFIPLPDKPDNFPDRPTAAYRVFVLEKKAGGEEDLTKIAEMWQQLEEKKKYFDEEAKDRNRFAEEMTEFRASEEGIKYFKELAIAVRRRRVNLAKFKYLKEMPKKPPAAVSNFIKSEMVKIKVEKPELKGDEIKKEATERWLNMDKEKKEALEKESLQTVDAYRMSLQNFKEGENWKAYVKMTKQKAKAKSKGGFVVPPMPVKPDSCPQKPADAFKHFCKEKAGLGKGLAELSKEFRELDAEDKAERTKEAAARATQYNQDLDAWNKGPEGRKYNVAMGIWQKRKALGQAKALYLKDEPKKPMGAYFLFSTAKKATMARDFPDIKGLGPVGKKIGELWRNISDEEKKEFMEKEKEEKALYESAMTEFRQTPGFKKYSAIVNRYSGGGGKAKGKAKAKVKPHMLPPKAPENLPKKPIATGLALYCKENGGIGAKQQEAWRNLQAEGQKEWNERVAEMNREYERQMKEFQATADGKKYLRLKAAFEQKSKMKQAHDRFLGGEKAPPEPKRPPTGYFIFVQKKRSSMPPGTMGEISKKLTQMWQSLTPEEKKEYDQESEKLKAEYTEKMKEYRNSAAYKAYERTVKSINAKPKPKAAPVAARAVAGKGRGRGAAPAGRGRGAPAAPAAAADKNDSSSDSDAMGSDADSSNDSSSDSD